MPPTSSLAALLGELNTAAPADYDPEAGYDLSEPHHAAAARAANHHDSAPSDNDSHLDDQEHNPRAHYVSVQESSLRKKSTLSEHEKLADPKYQGVKATRVQLYGQDDDDDDDDQEVSSVDEGKEATEDEQDDIDDEDVDAKEQGDVSDPDDFANLLRPSSSSPSVAPPSSSTAKPKKSLRFQEQQDATATSDDDDDQDDEGGNTIAAQLNQSQKLAKQLKAHRLEDADKGRNVRKQIKLWERTLEARIKAQPALRHLNQLPDPTIFADWLASSCSSSSSSSATKTLGGTIEELLMLSDRLFDARTRLHVLNNDSASLSGAAATVKKLDAASRKRKRPFTASSDDGPEEIASRIASLGSSSSSGDDVLSASISDLITFEDALDATRRPVLEKWSHKVSSAAASASSSNKFALKAVNRSPVAQIDAAMSGDGFERLVERTRVLRSASDETDGKIGAVLPSTTTAPCGTTTSSSRSIDAEVFDDTDFYSFLLRELIERRSTSSSSMTSSTTTLSNELYAANAKGKGRGKKAGVDTKASKGRRLRYEINEKIVAFMPPIPTRVRWTEEQIERLFSQLASRSEDVGENAQGEDEKQEGRIDLAGLKVFG